MRALTPSCVQAPRLLSIQRRPHAFYGFTRICWTKRTASPDIPEKTVLYLRNHGQAWERSALPSLQAQTARSSSLLPPETPHVFCANAGGPMRGRVGRARRAFAPYAPPQASSSARSTQSREVTSICPGALALFAAPKVAALPKLCPHTRLTTPSGPMLMDTTG